MPAPAPSHQAPDYRFDFASINWDEALRSRTPPPAIVHAPLLKVPGTPRSTEKWVGYHLDRAKEQSQQGFTAAEEALAQRHILEQARDLIHTASKRADRNPMAVRRQMPWRDLYRMGTVAQMARVQRARNVCKKVRADIVIRPTDVRTALERTEGAPLDEVQARTIELVRQQVARTKGLYDTTHVELAKKYTKRRVLEDLREREKLENAGLPQPDLKMRKHAHLAEDVVSIADRELRHQAKLRRMNEGAKRRRLEAEAAARTSGVHEKPETEWGGGQPRW